MMEEQSESSFEVEYISTSGVYKSWFSLIVIVQLFIGGIVLILINLWFFNRLYSLLAGTPFISMEPKLDLLWWLLLPLNIYGNIFLFWISVSLVSIGFYKILNKLHPTREGVYARGSKDWKYMNRRFWTSYFPIWLARALPLPWADIFVYRFFGVRIGRNVVLYEGYVDPELIEIGDHTMTSLNILIFSHLIYHDKVIIKRVKIGKNCILGPQTLVSPGTIMHNGSILGANSYTWVNQELDSDLIHVGTPVRMTFPIQSVEESQQKAGKIKKENGDV